MVLPKSVALSKSAPVPLKRSLRKKARAAYPSSHYQKAMYFKQKGDKSHALVEFLKATQENPRLTKAFYEQALIFRERGYLKLAQSALEQALALKPDYHEGRILLATIQIQQGNVGGAMQQLGQSLGISVAPKTNEEEELPQSTVLQSLHTLLPENVAEGIGKLTVGNSGKSDNSIDKAADKAEQKGNTKKSRKNSKPKPEKVQEDTVQIMEPKRSDNSAASLVAQLPSALPNTLRMFFPDNEKNGSSTPSDSVGWSGDSNSKADTVQEAANLDAAHLPSLPPGESKPDKSAGNGTSKSHKRAKKNWFSRIMTALDTSQEEQNQAPPAPPPIVADDDSKPGDAIVRSIPPLKPEPPPVVPTQVETFEKPDQPRQIVEKVAALANAAIASAAKTYLQFPNLANLNSTLLNTHNNGNENKDEVAAQPVPAPPLNEEPKPYKPIIAPNSDDPWSVRLRYLADHGTGTLKEGEAFMFSEETGEATLFLADGQTVRRTIYLPRDAQEVVKQRRPDILTPDDLLYNLSLLAKLMPKASETEPTGTNGKTQQTLVPQPPFEVNDLMGKSQRFWGWMKDALKL